MPPPQISAAQLEDEIRGDAPVLIVDVREPADFSHWPIDAAGAELVNIPLADIERDPHATIAALNAGDRPIRVMCARGVAAQRATARLADAGVDATAVSGGMRAWSQLLVASPVALPTPTVVVQFRREARGCLSYMVISDGRALVVDPALTIQPYLDEATRRDARITGVLDTHVHADHLSGMWDLAAATGAQRHLSAGAIARGGDPDALVVRDGAHIDVGSAGVRVLALPGHTTDNVGLVVDDVALIAGDSLFADSVARPDLETGDAGAATAARQLHRTLHERVLPLPPATILLPCHYGGGRLSGALAPTLREVQDTVPLLGLGEDAFALQVLAAMPPRPENYQEIIAANLARGEGDDIASLEIGANNCAASTQSG